MMHGGRRCVEGAMLADARGSGAHQREVGGARSACKGAKLVDIERSELAGARRAELASAEKVAVTDMWRGDGGRQHGRGRCCRPQAELRGGDPEQLPPCSVHQLAFWSLCIECMHVLKG